MTIEANKEFREDLVTSIKAVGQDIIDRAEDLVGTGEMLTDFNIWISFDPGFKWIPEIKVDRTYFSKNFQDYLSKKYEKEEKPGD